MEEIIDTAESAVSAYFKVRSFMEIAFGVVILIVAGVLLFFNLYQFSIVLAIIGVCAILYAKFGSKKRVFKTKYGNFVIADPSKTSLEEEAWKASLPFPSHPKAR